MTIVLAIAPLLCALATGQTLRRLETRQLPPDTHRPEVLALPDGGLLVVVVQPDPGMGQTPGRVKHRAYRYDADWRLVAPPFAVTAITEEYGEPADHRAALVNGELVVFYQNVVLNGTVPAGAPAEMYAVEQSLLMARFTLDGEELDRRAVVAHVKDFRDDNFPDFCILWREDHFLVSTGSLSPKLKIREVTLDGEVAAVHELMGSPGGIGGSIGNSLAAVGERLLLLSGTAPDRGELTVTELEGFTPVRTALLRDAAREWSFPVGNAAAQDVLLVGHIGRARGGPNDLLGNPYAPQLLVLGEDLQLLRDMVLGEGGFAHVHPTVTLWGERVVVAWSKAVARGPGQTPQVQLEILGWGETVE